MRKYYIIILIAILVLGSTAGVFYYLMQKEKKPIAQTNAAPLQVKKVLNEEVISPIGGFDNNSIWYFDAEGRLFKTNVDGSGLSEQPLPALVNKSIKRVLWPRNGSDFILVSDNNKIEKFYYDSQAKVYVKLAPNVQFLDWLPDGKRIVYIWKVEEGKNQLMISNADGTGYKKIADVFWPDLVLKASPDGETVLMYHGVTTEDTNKIYSASLESGKIDTLVEIGNNTNAMWVSASKFVYNQDSNVYLYDTNIKQSKDLKLKTQVSQIVPDNVGKILYANTNGKFVKINLDNLQIEKYFQPSNNIEAENLFLVGNTVYFVDKGDGKTYMLTK